MACGRNHLASGSAAFVSLFLIIRPMREIRRNHGKDHLIRYRAPDVRRQLGYNARVERRQE
jgi:hypothetical protein